MEDLVHQEKKIDISFSKAKTKFCLSFHYNSDNSYLFVNVKEIYKFKVYNGNVNCPTHFCLRSISNNYDYVDSKEVSFKGNVYDFSVYYGSVEISDNLNIHKYLTIKSNMQMIEIIKRILS